jgi:Protein of unknown function (DUF3891)
MNDAHRRRRNREKDLFRIESETGWWLIMHPDHARLAGDFAAAWGNAEFRRPEPRARVLKGIACHDDGWAAPDAHPSITREGKPAAFSTELVGKYSSFEEIDLDGYLEVRDRSVRVAGEEDPYAGLLIAMHTYNLITTHTLRSTIAADGLALLDGYLSRLIAYQDELRRRIARDTTLSATEAREQTILEQFRFLQACDNLSLLTCVGYQSPAHLLHPLPLKNGGAREVKVLPAAPHHFRLDPWPFEERQLSFAFPARHVTGKVFADSAHLEDAFRAAPREQLRVQLST